MIMYFGLITVSGGKDTKSESNSQLTQEIDLANDTVSGGKDTKSESNSQPGSCVESKYINCFRR